MTHYKDKLPLFESYGVKNPINSLTEDNIYLKSGGYLVINPTEALTSIDINSGRATSEKNIEITATCVRIPVLVSHAESINIEFENEFTIEKIRNALNSAEGCVVIDERKDGGYITPLEAEGKNETFISRIRKDNSNKNSVNLWCVSDNLLRGAALNAVEIAEAYIKNK